jgi:hypothetical protein
MQEMIKSFIRQVPLASGPDRKPTQYLSEDESDFLPIKAKNQACKNSRLRLKLTDCVGVGFGSGMHSRY